MADQNITALPVATSPTSSDQLLLVGATEEKLIDYDKLADAILTKLTSKQYTLDQGTKTLPAALNELNSKTLIITMSGLTDSTGNIRINYLIHFRGCLTLLPTSEIAYNVLILLSYQDGHKTKLILESETLVIIQRLLILGFRYFSVCLSESKLSIK